MKAVAMGGDASHVPGPALSIRMAEEGRRSPAVVVDLLLLNQHSSARALVVEEIGKACRQMGWFQVANHGIHHSVIKDALEVASDFFELPKAEKEKFELKDVRKPIRYCTSSADGFGVVRNMLKHHANPLSQWVSLWPLNPPGYREKMGKYASEVRRVSLEVMGAIFESLGLGQAYLSEKLDEGEQVMAIHCYPPSHQHDVMTGLAPHSDYGLITILFQTCHGLQVIDGEDWISIPKIPETLHVHIGDNLEVISNCQHKSLLHKAVLNSEKRVSIASIHCLSMDEKVTCAKELVDEQHPKLYKESTFRDFLNYLHTTDITKGRFIETLRIAQP